MGKYILFFVVLINMVIPATAVVRAADQIVLFPETPYDRYIIYQNLVLFWFAIIGLIIIIRMKLKEIERTQKLGLNNEEKEIPFLE